MRNIFATTCIVKDLRVGSRVSRQEQFDCVTLEGNFSSLLWLFLYLIVLGDQVSRRGPMTGGYIDVKRSRLELSRNIRELKAEKDNLEVGFLSFYFRI